MKLTERPTWTGRDQHYEYTTYLEPVFERWLLEVRELRITGSRANTIGQPVVETADFNTLDQAEKMIDIFGRLASSKPDDATRHRLFILAIKETYYPQDATAEDMAELRWIQEFGTARSLGLLARLEERGWVRGDEAHANASVLTESGRTVMAALETDELLFPGLFDNIPQGEN